MVTVQSYDLLVSTTIFLACFVPLISSVSVTWVNTSKTEFQNSTYFTTKGSILQFQCKSDKPTMWIAKAANHIVKKSKQSSSAGTIYISDLILNREKDESIEVNFTCLLAPSKYDYNFTFSLQKYTSTSCVKIEDTGGATLGVHIEKDIPMNNCTELEEPRKQQKCSYDLRLNVHTSTAICIGSMSNASAAVMSCQNFDACELLRRSKLHNPIMDTCKGLLTTERISSNTTIVNETLPPSPKAVYCNDEKQPGDTDEVWSSVYMLYPTFNDSDWKTRLFLESDERALKSNFTLILRALTDYEISRFLSSTYTIKRETFAVGENVQFVCLAIKSFYMDGFVWTLDPGKETERILVGDKSHILNNKSILIEKVDVMLERGKFSSIRCEGAVWNSKNVAHASQQIYLTDAIKPSYTKLNCTGNTNTTDQQTCTCEYNGWPRPDVDWKYSITPSKVGNKSDPQPVEGEYYHAENQTWLQSITFNVPSGEVIKIECEVNNAAGSHRSNSYTIAPPRDNTVLIVVTVSCLLVTALAVTLIVVYYRGRQRLKLASHSQSQLNEEINMFYYGASKSSVLEDPLLLPYKEEFEISSNDLILEETKLGEGHFGYVFKGRVGEVPVAIKTVIPTADFMYFKSLISELKVLQYVGPHRNIVNLIGANTEKIHKREIYLILDYCSNGNLVSFLRLCRNRFVDFFSTNENEKEYPLYENSKDTVITTGNLIKFSYEIASAMDHLSSKNVIHGDLAARNVLITEDLVAKVCDFGLAKQLLHYSVYVQRVECPLPLRWLALESLRDMEFSLASDVWSFGVCLWEIFSLAELPYAGVQWTFESYKMLLEGYRMEKPRYANDSIYKLMIECWDSRPQQRPSYQHLINQLRTEEDMIC